MASVITMSRSEEDSSSSLFSSMTSAFSSLFPSVHAEEEDEDSRDEGEGEDEKEGDDDKEEGGDEEEEEEEEEEDEPEDPQPAIYEECENSKECSPAKHHFLECQERVEAGKGFHEENCVEEFFHLAHCASSCTAPRLFSKLK
ncbi:Non-heme 11 kDa protein of cytochrome bc1 complex [Acaromyces ingoldii]|uniref:Cytochrome b-c1 complex subunit 6, mitochondrial n=1 Tax=Acaromyces ingoldii TaxID=215250 RepID=A0A316YT97_9BASI|nr:Non-heme 11 kDa protein of cytochrome bc1 complex [Acaromyces ingoldii]PWN92004.1 Non-heme 11 kDa protein of cytochrome bc1 complex [Acaromyces ingoldii]